MKHLLEKVLTVVLGTGGSKEVAGELTQPFIFIDLYEGGRITLIL